MSPSFILLSLALIFPFYGWAASGTKDALFKGKIIRVASRGEWIRVQVDPKNAKFLNKSDGVEFWHEVNDGQRCKGHIMGRTEEYLLVGLVDKDICRKSMGLASGTYLKFYSEEMERNMTQALELRSILLKKKLVVGGRVRKLDKELSTHIERVAEVNERYDVLRKELESKWQGELQALEEDRLSLLQKHGDGQRDLDEIDLKLERYKIDEDVSSLDRWSLDSRLYYKR